MSSFILNLYGVLYNCLATYGLYVLTDSYWIASLVWVGSVLIGQLLKAEGERQLKQIFKDLEI